MTSPCTVHVIPKGQHLRVVTDGAGRVQVQLHDASGEQQLLAGNLESWDGTALSGVGGVGAVPPEFAAWRSFERMLVVCHGPPSHRMGPWCTPPPDGRK